MKATHPGGRRARAACLKFGRRSFLSSSSTVGPYGTSGELPAGPAGTRGGCIAALAGTPGGPPAAGDGNKADSAPATSANTPIAEQRRPCRDVGQARLFGDVGSMSGLPEADTSGYGAILPTPTNGASPCPPYSSKASVLLATFSCAGRGNQRCTHPLAGLGYGVVGQAHDVRGGPPPTLVAR